MTSPMIRPATADDAEFIQLIENMADTMTADALGVHDWPVAGDGRARLESDGIVLMAEAVDVADADALASPVGFAHLLDADGLAHLEQVSVHPDHGRRGLGRALVEASLTEARDRGYSRVTLRTYAELPWNAPFYASCGFLESLPETSFQRSLVDVESALGLDRHGRRIQMTVEL